MLYSLYSPYNNNLLFGEHIHKETGIIASGLSLLLLLEFWRKKAHSGTVFAFSQLGGEAGQPGKCGICSPAETVGCWVPGPFWLGLKTVVMWGRQGMGGLWARTKGSLASQCGMLMTFQHSTSVACEQRPALLERVTGSRVEAQGGPHLGGLLVELVNRVMQSRKGCEVGKRSSFSFLFS